METARKPMIDLMIVSGRDPSYVNTSVPYMSIGHPSSVNYPVPHVSTFHPPSVDSERAFSTGLSTVSVDKTAETLVPWAFVGVDGTREGRNPSNVSTGTAALRHFYPSCVNDRPPSVNDA
jgi:hypothetical protein